MVLSRSWQIGAVCYDREHRQRMIGTVWPGLNSCSRYDDVITCRHFPHFTGHLWGNHRSPGHATSLTKGQSCRDLTLSDISLNSLWNKQSSCRRFETPWFSWNVTAVYPAETYPCVLKYYDANVTSLYRDCCGVTSPGCMNTTTWIVMRRCTGSRNHGNDLHVVIPPLVRT